MNPLSQPRLHGNTDKIRSARQGGNDYILLNWMPDPVKYRLGTQESANAGNLVMQFTSNQEI